MIIELMTQHYLTSPNIKNIIKSRKIAYLGAKFFLAPCFFMLTYVISWEQRKLIEIVKSIDTGKSKFQSDSDNGKFAILGSTSIIGYDDSYDYDGDFILTARVGANAGSLYRYTGKAKISDNTVFIQTEKNIEFVYYMLTKFDIKQLSFGTGQPLVKASELKNLDLKMPSQIEEQQKIGSFFSQLDTLITLHQREPPKEDKILNDIKTDTLFHEYYCQWLVIYKEGSVRGVTMQKYHLTAEWVKKLIPDVKLCDFDRITYQQLINDYAETHERQTTMDFHHQLKGAILDAVDDGLIARDPTRKVIIKGKSPNDKKKKYLSRYELQKLLTSLDLNSGLNMDWLILLIAKTGMRFSEAIAVTPMDFDFTHQTLSVNKTWDYKGEGGFQPTKNKSSVRKIRLDWQTVGQFYAIVRELNDTAPIFVSKEKKIYNSTLNDVLERHCKAVGIPTISVHGLRHTHASLLLFDGVSIASVAQRLGHSSINTTQKTYLHIIRELENKDIDLIMKSISSLLD